MKRKRFSGAAIGAAVILSVGLSLVSVPAHAYENWQKSHHAGTNFRLQMSSTANQMQTYYLNSAIVWSGPAGPLSHNRAVSPGYHNTTMITGGYFSAKNAYVYCPPGVTCAS